MLKSRAVAVHELFPCALVSVTHCFHLSVLLFDICATRHAGGSTPDVSGYVQLQASLRALVPMRPHPSRPIPLDTIPPGLLAQGGLTLSSPDHCQRPCLRWRD